jgi:hypothetical protein
MSLGGVYCDSVGGAGSSRAIGGNPTPRTSVAPTARIACSSRAPPDLGGRRIDVGGQAVEKGQNGIVRGRLRAFTL